VSPSQRAALFLDRDGVINADQAYVHRIEDFVWIPGVFDTVRAAKQLGLPVIVVTNQAGIARGYYSELDFRSLTGWMEARFAAAGAPLTAVYYCPYHPEGLPPYNSDSPMRKPGAGMLLQAAEEHALDLRRSVLIGDQESDIAAGRAAGLMQTALFAPAGPRPTQADVVLASHADACGWLSGLHRG
jgi:D-glycero-D-manno-heptose 1,7-bisphosphate phosphatase